MRDRLERIPAWRMQDGRSLDLCGSIQVRSGWIGDVAGRDELGDVNILDVMSRAQARDDRDDSRIGGFDQSRYAQDNDEDLHRRINVIERSNSGDPAAMPSLFQTGTGKSVQVSGAAMKRALVLLGGDDATGSSKRRSTSAGKPVLGFQSPGDNGANSLFQTATGKMVPISSTALNKARSLLCGDHGEGQISRPKGFTTPGLSGGISRVPASVPPFKQPRRRFTSPLALASVKRFQLPNESSTTKSTRLPLSEIDGNKPRPTVNRMAFELNGAGHGKDFKLRSRAKLQEYFRRPPQTDKYLVYVPKEIQWMTADSANAYKFTLVNGKAGAGELRNMLLEAGAKAHLATNEWVQNHYRWIVWKLACQQRSYPRKARGFLNVQNVLRELKYRYVKEIENSQRSILKKICERDAFAAQTMVLCVSAIRQKAEKKTESCLVEVTDGWYCLNAALDAPLSKQLKAGKLFVGQKLQISGASLIGAIGGLPPLEAVSVAYLAIHINGTYRAHWAEPLGARKKPLSPLAFRCIKAAGGLVFSTCVVVTRIYPLLYREKLKDGSFIIRNAKAEDIVQMNFEQRKISIAEGIMATFQNEDEDLNKDENFRKGAKLYEMLEFASDPEVLMADMTSENHAALSAYQAKKMYSTQAVVEKRIQTALEQSDLLARDVSPFFKVDVTGLQSNLIDVPSSNGSITIWNPSATLISELVEGEAYVVSGLKPASQSQAGQLHLNASKSSRWQKTCARGLNFEFAPRFGLQLSNLVEVQVCSEFDVAALVLHVGEVYKTGERSRQWIFVSDGSLQDGEASLLAIDFSALANCFSQFESAYCGNVIGFCNLTKQHPDEVNRVWVAQASNLTLYSSKLNSKAYQHLSKPAAMVMQWALFSPQVVEFLKQRVLKILGSVV